MQATADELMALTVWQPWADLLMLGAKPLEFRSHDRARPYVGQRIVIHAGVHRWDREEIRQLHDRVKWDAERHNDPLAAVRLVAQIALPLLERMLDGSYNPLVGVGLGTMRLTAVQSVAEYAPKLRNDSSRVGHFNFGWRFEDPQRFDWPVPARGSQGFWRWGKGRT